MVVNFTVALIVSRFFKAPPGEVQELVENIRIPTTKKKIGGGVSLLKGLVPWAWWSILQKSVNNPEVFWEEVAEEHFVWLKKWDRVLDWDFTKPEVKWFDGAQLNITVNCLDRHLHVRENKTAILFEPNDPKEEAQHITY
uniref:Acetyl-coenzyme A synthetase N-terminal domain-containing protein n=1 Tax=Hippocampus comes TaxID=109280 RepID=A0A3Q2XSC3_HIPCM